MAFFDSEPAKRPKLLRKSIKKLEIGSVWLLDTLTLISIFRMSQTGGGGDALFF